MPKTTGHRGKSEEEARNSCRSLAHSWGAKIYKIEDSYVKVTPCLRWSDGLITAFNGWADAHNRLLSASENPEFVTGGIYLLPNDKDERAWLAMKEHIE